MSENSQSPQIFTNFSFSAKNKSSAWLQSSNNTKSFLQVAFSYNLLVCQGIHGRVIFSRNKQRLCRYFINSHYRFNFSLDVN